MKLSDILKKVTQQQNVSRQKLEDASIEQQKPEKVPSLSQQQKINMFSTEDKIVKKPEKYSEISAEEVYSKGIKFLRVLFKDLIVKKNDVSINELTEVVKNIIQLILDNNEKILLYTYYSTVDSYVYAHSLNVAIYSCLIAATKKLDIKEIEEVVLCALLHDIGMARILDFINTPRKLFPQEFEEVKKHSEYARVEMSKLNLPTELKNKITNIIIQVHERVDGSGYPLHLSSEDIDLYARIISIADVYEALSHPRPYRERILPHEAIVTLVKHAQSELDTSLVKIFVERMSLFPVGSYVKLNTGEIGRVIGTNPSLPVRPKVKIILTAEGNPSKKEEIVNLAENTKIAIVEPVDETKIDIKDKKFLLQIKAQRWWVKDVTI